MYGAVYVVIQAPVRVEADARVGEFLGRINPELLVNDETPCVQKRDDGNLSTTSTTIICWY